MKPQAYPESYPYLRLTNTPGKDGTGELQLVRLMSWTQVLEACGIFVPGVPPAVPPGVTPRAITGLMQSSCLSFLGALPCHQNPLEALGVGYFIQDFLTHYLPRNPLFASGCWVGEVFCSIEFKAHTPNAQSSMPLRLLLRP